MRRTVSFVSLVIIGRGFKLEITDKKILFYIV